MIPHHPTRRDEISALLRLGPDEVVTRAGDRLRVHADLDSVHNALACEMAALIEEQNARGEPTRLILPVGPTGQYPIFVDLVNQRQISLKSCWFFFMDEYADEQGRTFPPSHPLSFAGIVERMFLSALDPALAIPAEQVIVPNEKNIDSLARTIEELGGIDACFGGIGIHGHLAFNEPEKGVRSSQPRLVQLNDYTTTINAIRACVGGNLEGFPRQAYTLGLRQILGARRLRLACRNGIPLDWANTVLRLTLLGEPAEDYPCTFATQHPDCVVHTDEDTLRQPDVLL